MKSSKTSLLPPERFYFREYNIIEKKLAALLKGKSPQSLYGPCAYILSNGGKRIRPFLVIASAYCLSGNTSNVYNAAVAVEVLHNFTLVHDDIMDNANIRRGLPTVHIKYDLSTAILAGDNLIAIAYKSLLKDSGKMESTILAWFTKGIIEVCEGQSLDKEFESREDVTINEYLKMIGKKTAALAEMCCNIGAQLGGGDSKEIAALSGFGKNLGMAFQIQDDLLDIMGDESEFGKTVGGDLVEGKKTFLLLKALESATGNDKEQILKVIKNKGIKKSEVNKYRKLYEDLGIINETKRKIRRYTNLALKSLAPVKPGLGKDTLVWLANNLLERSS